MAGYAAKIIPNRNPNASGPSHRMNRTRRAIMALRVHAHPGKTAESLGKTPPPMFHANGRTRIV